MILVNFTKLLIAASLAVAAGCGTTGMVPDHDAGPDGSDGGSGGGDTCGQCVPGPANGWDYPALVWIGDEKDAPACPAGAGKVVYEGHAALDAPTDCGTCSCSAPTGSCGLPATMTPNATTCSMNGTSTPHTPFDPAGTWDGTCDTNEAIPSGKLCSGVKCVQSLTIGPLSMNENVGVPSQSPTQSAPTWKTFARACGTLPRTSCGEGANFTFCLAAPPPTAGFRVCIYRGGDNECAGPALMPYTEKHVFYDTYQDTRACSACTCGAPTGSTCSSKISIYTDGACSTPAYSAPVDSTGSACHDLPPGTPLGSKSATAPAYTAGSCTPGGGEPTGAATPTTPSTYCCLPAP